LVDIISMDIKLPSNTGESESWDAHAEFLDLARAKDLYVKILVDEGTAGAEVERATRMIAAAGRTIPAFLQPVIDPAGRVMISAERLTDFYRLASRSLGTVRVLPQTHKLLGLR
jgi:7-carboxy-7-deazaguanine synthase